MNKHLILILTFALLLSACDRTSWRDPNTPVVKLAEPEPICTTREKQAIKGWFFPCLEVVCVKSQNEIQGEIPYCTRDKTGKIQSLHVKAFGAVSICIDNKVQILGVKLNNCQNYISDLLHHQGDV